jgi:DNA repair protein RadC
METGIKTWAEADRPREKLLHSGAAGLTDSELLAILIRSGSDRDTAVDLAKEILRTYDNDLARLARVSAQELARFRGMGRVKAVTVLAALELANRRRGADAKRRKKIRSSRDAAELMMPVMADLAHEEFYMLLLNRANEIIYRHHLSKGGIAGTVVDPRIVFKIAIDHLASGMILFHNHPSGNLKPSAEDIKLTRRLQEAGRLLDVKVLDHLIIAGDGWFSFADEGMV